MIKLSGQDFNTYFEDAYARHPKLGVVGRITRAPEGNNVVRFIDLQGGISVVPVDDFEWNHVALPPLGYINTAAGGKGLAYFTRAVGRITAKGFSRRTVLVREVQEVVTVHTELGLNVDKYYNTLTLSTYTIQECFNPTFLSLPLAVALLSSRADATGVAINHDIALTLGLRADNAFILLWKEVQVAFSPDGRIWTLLKEEFRGPLQRTLPGLIYAN